MEPLSVRVQYTNSGQAAGMTLGGIAYQGTVTTPVTVSLGYDSLQRVTSDSVAVGNKTLFSQTQTYDNVGNMLQLATTVPTTSGGSLTDNQAYCYDALNRLAWAGNSGTPAGGDHCGSTPGGSTHDQYMRKRTAMMLWIASPRERQEPSPIGIPRMSMRRPI